MSESDSFCHVAVIGGTGSGKSSSLVIPGVMQTNGSLIIVDPASEIYRTTSAHLQERGYTVQVFAPASHKSATFNPLHYFRTPDRIKELADAFAALSVKETQDYWIVQTSRILYLVMVCLMNQPEEKFRNLANVRWLIDSLGTIQTAQGTPVIRYMLHWLSNEQDRVNFQAFCSLKDQLRSSILSSVTSPLAIWQSPSVCQMTSFNSLNLELRTQKTAIYICVPEDRLDFYRPLLSIFFTVVFEILLQGGQNPDEFPVTLYLDEFGQFRIHRFATLCTVLRKRRVALMLILQSLSQLEKQYGKTDAETIWSGGVRSRIFLGNGLEWKAAKYLEDILGNQTIKIKVEGERTSRFAARPLLTADEIRQIPRDEGILVSGAYRPFRLKLMPYYADPVLATYANKPLAHLSNSAVMKPVEYVEFRG